MYVCMYSCKLCMYACMHVCVYVLSVHRANYIEEDMYVLAKTKESKKQHSTSFPLLTLQGGYTCW